MMSRKLAFISLGLLSFSVSGCVLQPVPVAPPPQPVYYAPGGYYAAPAYPAYGYYGGPSLNVDIGGRGGYGRGGYGRWR